MPGGQGDVGSADHQCLARGFLQPEHILSQRTDRKTPGWTEPNVGTVPQDRAYAGLWIESQKRGGRTEQSC